MDFEEDIERKNEGPPQLILEIALRFRERIGTDWVISEGGAAGPSKSPYGHNARYTALAIAGPIKRAKSIETGKSDRIGNMSEFTTALLSFFLDVLKERRTVGKERYRRGTTLPCGNLHLGPIGQHNHLQVKPRCRRAGTSKYGNCRPGDGIFV
jgi:hypothetical protein